MIGYRIICDVYSAGIVLHHVSTLITKKTSNLPVLLLYLIWALCIAWSEGGKTGHKHIGTMHSNYFNIEAPDQNCNTNNDVRESPEYMATI